MKRLSWPAWSTLVASVVGTVAAIDYLRGRDVATDRFIPRTFESTVLDEPREMLVHLPESYHRAPDRRFDVVYVLDGSSLDGPTAEGAAMMARLALTPEVIVVGLPNVSGAGRQRDYTPPFMRQDIDTADSALGRGDRFLDFLEQELVPLVERDYRTTGRRILSGHSRGGLLVVYALMARPALFDGYLAHSPALWRDDEALVASRWRRGSPTRSTLDRFLYLSIGADEVPRMMAGFDHLRDVLAQRAAAAGLRWQSDVVAGADHQANGAWASPLGLRAYFDARRPDRPRPGSRLTRRGRACQDSSDSGDRRPA